MRANHFSAASISLVSSALLLAETLPKTAKSKLPAISPLVCPACAVIHSRLKELRLWQAASADADKSHTSRKRTAADADASAVIASRAAPTSPKTTNPNPSSPAKTSPLPRVPWNKGRTWHKGQINVTDSAVIAATPKKSILEQPKVTSNKVDKRAKVDPGSAAKRQRMESITTVGAAAAAAAAAPAVKATPAKAKPSGGKVTQSERHMLQRQEMAMIMKSITRHGFDLKHVEPDGSCLFRALSIQVRFQTRM